MTTRFLGRLLILIMGAFLGLGCRESGYPKYERAEVEFLHLYASRDLPTVEAALLKHRARALQLQAERLEGVDFDSALALVNSRLCYFYAHTGRTNEAERFFLEATNHMNLRKRAEGLHHTPVSRDDVYRVVEHADLDMKAGWKSGR